MKTSARDSAIRGTLPLDVRGVRIRLAPRGAEEAPLVHGAFRVPTDDLEVVSAHVARALVLVVQRDLAPRVLSPFRDTVLFDDDQTLTHAGIEGAFTLDVFDLLKLPPEARAGHWHLFVSLGPHVSNVVEADVAG